MADTIETAPENWHQKFYDRVFAKYCLKRSAEDRAKTVAFLMDKLHLKKGGTLFDQGCGDGNLSQGFSAQGVNIIGVDLIEDYIAQARKNHDATQNATGAYYQDNAYTFVTPQPCDAAINWWTSFGYSESDDKNAMMFQRIFDSLKTGGYFGFEYKNGVLEQRNFADKDVLRYEEDHGDGHKSIWVSTLNRETGMVFKDWEHIYPDGHRQTNKGGGAKLYRDTEIQNLLENSGFVAIDFYADVAGAEFCAETSNRCIAIARKP